MRGVFYRYLVVLYKFFPIALAFLRDRRRFLLFGGSRQPDEETHRRRAERISDVMLDLGPAFVKVGQVLSTRPDIVPPIYAEQLGTLQDEVPEDVGGDPMDVVQSELDEKLDLSTIEPVAGGSLAFVYTAAYEGERIALKVRRPGLRSIIERDLRVVRGLIPLVGLFVSERHRYSIENVADDFEEVIFAELDFDRERTIMSDIRDNFADDDRVVIPETHEELSSERILAMGYLTGRKVTDDDAFEGLDVEASEMANRIVHVFLKMGLVDGVFHADPHPGNLAVTDDGKLLLYDFGMSDRIPPSMQKDIVGLYRALVHRDVDGLVDALIALDVLEPTVDRTEVRRVLELVIENLEGRAEITWRAIIVELTARLREFPFRIPPDVMLLIRVGTVSEGVCRQLDPEFDFLSAIRSFLLAEGLAEHEHEALAEETRQELRRSIPAIAGLPAKSDRVLSQIERGEITVRTAGHDAGSRDAGAGYAVLAGSLLIAASILTFHEQPYEIVALAFGAIFVFMYLFGRRSS